MVSYRTFPAAIMSFLAAATDLHADELAARFANIGVGETRSAVVMDIGREPDAQTVSQTLGVVYSTLRWNSAGSAFVVRLVGFSGTTSRVIGTKSCAAVGAGDC